jgi:hypothetical protein
MLPPRFTGLKTTGLLIEFIENLQLLIKRLILLLQNEESSLQTTL